MAPEGSYKLDSVSDGNRELTRLEQQSQVLRELERRMLCDAGLRSDHRVLEVGCGPGFVTSLLCELASDGEVLATDTDGKLLALCEKNVVRRPKLGLSTLLVQGTALPLPASRVDFAYLRFVLQHVPERKELLAEVHRALADDGTICALDSDDGLVLHYPEDPMISDMLSQAQETQSRMGGDRLVGRKLGAQLREAGFADVRSKVLTFTASDLPFELLARILLGFKLELSGRRAELDPWIASTRARVASGEFFLAAGIVLSVARKRRAA